MHDNPHDTDANPRRGGRFPGSADFIERDDLVGAYDSLRGCGSGKVSCVSCVMHVTKEECRPEGRGVLVGRMSCTGVRRRRRTPVHTIGGVVSAPESVKPAISPWDHDGAMCPCLALPCVKQLTIHLTRDAPGSVSCWWQHRSVHRRPNTCSEFWRGQDRELGLPRRTPPAHSNPALKSALPGSPVHS